MADPRVATLEAFIRRSLLEDPAVPLAADTPLLGERLVDSIGVTMLVAFVEQEFGVRFDDTDLRAGRCESIADVLALVDKRS